MEDVQFDSTAGLPVDTPHRRPLFLPLLLAIAIALTGGCANTSSRNGDEISADSTAPGSEVQPDIVSYPEYRDPLMRFNRAVFTFNDVTFRYVLIPASKAYMFVLPETVRGSIGNFFYNLKTPIYVVNHLLQWEPKRMGHNLMRFGLNTTVGLLGLFDPAEAWFDLEREETHFEDTLADYGAGYGVYLVLPFFGPSDLRNGTSQIVDYFLNPIGYLTEQPTSSAIRAFDYFQEAAPGTRRYETLKKEAEDPYLFFRNLYLQGVQRDAAQ